MVGTIFEWEDEAELNRFEARRLDSGNVLLLSGRGPRGISRAWVSTVLPEEAFAELADAALTG